MSECLALPDGAGSFRQDFSGPVLLRNTAGPVVLRLQGCHLLWPLFPERSSSTPGPVCRSYNPGSAETLPVWAGPRSLATTWGITVVFSSSGYLDVSVPRVSSLRLWIHRSVTRLQRAGLPHSEIHGSKLACSSPRLIAAYHVLRRLLMPRHPPCALCILEPDHFTCAFSSAPACL